MSDDIHTPDADPRERARSASRATGCAAIEDARRERPRGALTRAHRRRGPRRHRLRAGRLAVRHAARRHHQARARAPGVPRGGRRGGARATRARSSRRGSSRRPPRSIRSRRELDEYFAGRRRALRADARLGADRPVRAAGAARDRRDPLRRPLSYAEVAAEAGSPRGARAAGNALGSNPIPIVVPCHRVLRTGGALGGYGGGLERKRYLLELEGALTPASAPAL